MIVLFQIPELLSRAAPFVIPILFPAPEILILFKGLCVDLNKWGMMNMLYAQIFKVMGLRRKEALILILRFFPLVCAKWLLPHNNIYFYTIYISWNSIYLLSIRLQ